MTIKLQFPEPKDPRDDDWFAFMVDADVASITDMTVIESDADISPPGDSITSGDDLDVVPDPISVYSFSIGTDKRTITFRCKGGTPGKNYAITAELIKAGTSGGTVFRSVLLLVTGL